MLFVFILDVSVANKLCEQNKRKIEEKILLRFLYDEDYSNSNYANYEPSAGFCRDLHILYPQMQPNECQVATKEVANPECQAAWGRPACVAGHLEWTRKIEYVKDYQNIQNVLKKYVFKIEAKNELATPNQCITQVSVKFNYDINDEAIEKIKTGLKSLDDGNRAYLHFMRGDSDYDYKKYREDVLLLYRFVGDKLFKDFNKYKSNVKINGQHQLNVSIAKDIAETNGYWGIYIQHGVLDFSSLSGGVDYVDLFKHHKEVLDAFDVAYTEQCHNKGDENKSVTIDKFKTITWTCDELKDLLDSYVESLKQGANNERSYDE